MRKEFGSTFGKETIVYLYFKCLGRDDGKEVDVGLSRVISHSMSDVIIIDMIRDAIREFALHEVDECLMIDGVRKFDPHIDMNGIEF
jgi:hypothetical protein